ncbi:ABC transporter substrate-binding protein [Mesorhizobium sp. CAU 1741]|uniref:ABC transporter substrate-binding protein n=1 Tax=Mesorhizobium sp. CAU 1741 TaxID=3140366 RepID=UPI00325BD29E
MLKTLGNIVGAAIVAGLLTTSTYAQEEPIKLGIVLSTSGPVGFLGAAEENALDMLVHQVNEEGGINGRQIEMIAYNDNSDAAQANTFTQRLVNSDEVDLIIGGTISPIAMAMIPIVERGGVPYISVGGSLAIVDPVKKWVFKTPHTDRQVAQRMLMDLQDQGSQKIGVLFENSGFGQSGLKELKAYAGEYGVEIVAEEQFGTSDTDTTPQLTKIRDTAGVQAVVIFAGAGAPPAIATKSYANLGMKLPLYLPHSAVSPEYLALTAGAAEGARMPTALFVVRDAVPEDSAQKTIIEKFYTDYEERYGVVPPPFAANTYDAGLIAIDALKRTTSLDKAAIRDAIEETKDLVGLQGVFTMSPEDHHGLPFTSLKMFVVEDNQFKLLD